MFTILLLFLSWQMSLAYTTFDKTPSTFVSKWKPTSFPSNNGLKVYINCSDEPNRSNCTVIANNTANSNESYHSCLISHNETQNLTQFELAGVLDSDKFVLVWKNHLEYEFGVFNLNKCKLTVSSFEVRLFKKPIISIHEIGFDVFFKNAQLCAKKLCRTRFDNNGEMLKATHGYDEDDCSYVQPISTNFSEKSFFYFCKNYKQHSNARRRSSLDGWINVSDVFDIKQPVRDGFYLIGADGAKKYLAEDNGKSFTSTTHGLITICAIYDSYINCSQFDTQGQLKFARIMAGGSDDYIEILDMRNLSQGGCLLLLKEYWDCSETNGPRDMCHHVTLGKIDSKGKIVGSRVVEGYYGSKMDMFEDEEGNYCTMSSHTKKSSIFWGEKKVNFSYKCFNVTDLSQRPFSMDD